MLHSLTNQEVKNFHQEIKELFDKHRIENFMYAFIVNNGFSSSGQLNDEHVPAVSSVRVLYETANKIGDDLVAEDKKIRDRNKANLN